MAGGLKNAFRMSFDRATGDIYLGDVGNNGREEIDFIKAGTLGSQTLARNFGWPVKEGLLDPPAGVTVGSSFDYSNPDASVPMIDPIQEHHHIGDKTVDSSLRDNTIIGGFVYHGPIASLAGKYIYGDYWTNHLYTANFDRNTSPSAFNGANLTHLQEVSAQWEALIAGGDPAHLDLEFPVQFAEDSKGNLYIVSFGNSPNDSLNGGSVRNSVGLGIGQIYELVPFLAPALGDINRDGHVNAADVSALLAALVDLKAYQGSLTNVQLAEFADLTGDGNVTNADLQGLIQYLISGGGSVGGTPPAVPEPSSLALAIVAGIVLLVYGRYLVCVMPKLRRRLDDTFRAEVRNQRLKCFGFQLFSRHNSGFCPHYTSALSQPRNEILYARPFGDRRAFRGGMHSLKMLQFPTITGLRRVSEIPPLNAARGDAHSVSNYRVSLRIG